MRTARTGSGLVPNMEDDNQFYNVLACNTGNTTTLWRLVKSRLLRSPI